MKPVKTKEDRDSLVEFSSSPREEQTADKECAKDVDLIAG
jgi:hypothetical protein